MKVVCPKCKYENILTNIMVIEGVFNGSNHKFLIPFKCQRCGKCCKKLMANCKYLEKGKDGKYACKIYDKRPSVCRSFPFQCDSGITKAEKIGCEGIKIFNEEWNWLRKRKGWSYMSSTSFDNEIEGISG